MFWLQIGATCPLKRGLRPTDGAERPVGETSSDHDLFAILRSFDGGRSSEVLDAKVEDLAREGAGSVL